MAKSKGNALGSWSFLIGVVLAVIVGVVGTLGTTWIYVLVALGIIVGLLNIADKEVGPFLMSGAVLIISSALGQSVVASVPILDRVMQSLMLLFVPAVIIVAIKHVFSLARR